MTGPRKKITPFFLQRPRGTPMRAGTDGGESVRWKRLVPLGPISGCCSTRVRAGNGAATATVFSTPGEAPERLQKEWSDSGEA